MAEKLSAAVSSLIARFDGGNIGRHRNLEGNYFFQPLVQRCRRAITIPSQPRNLWPQPRPQGDEAGKSCLQELSLGIDKTLHRREAEIEFVRNYFHCGNSYAPCFRGARDGCRFHIDGLRSERVSQPRLLRCTRHRSETHQYAFAAI